MAIDKYQFLNEAGMNILIENLFAKINTRIDERIDSKIGTINGANNSVDNAFDESEVDNRLIPVGVPDNAPLVIEYPTSLSDVTPACTLECNGEPVPGTFTPITTDEEFVELVDPDNPTDIIIPVEDKELVVLGIAPVEYEFIPEDTNTYAPTNVVVPVIVIPENSHFTVTYDGNGATSGTVPIDNNSYSDGDLVTVLNNNNMEKAGYTFAGWNTQTNITGITYDIGDTFIISSNVTLYAVWNEILL